MSSVEHQALELKNQGNTAHQSGDYRKAIYYFSKGLELNPGPPTNYLLYSNRSASYTLLEDFESALADADTVLSLKPEWPKGYSRKGAALQHLKRFREAINAYETGLKLDSESEVMKKGLEEAQQARLIHEPKPLDKTISPNTKSRIHRGKTLQQLTDVVWHLEIMKDKIWLADPPKAPFRPRSLFIIDSMRVQMLHMAAHPTRDSISLDELLDFIVSTCTKHSIRPGAIEFSDHKLQIVLQEGLKDLNIGTRTCELGPVKTKFFEETIKSFEDKEMEQWKDNPKFAGVLRQRAQKGLMSVPGGTGYFFKYLLSAAAHFYRSKAYLYYTKALGIRIEPSKETKVALITRNTSGQYGVAMSTISNCKQTSDCGTQCFLFSDASNIPFDDADLIERNGWDIAEQDRWPLPLVYSADHNADMQRPSLEDLKWYEIAFRAISLFVSNTFKKPTFMQMGPLCYRCNVHMHSGRVSVIISAPPSEDAQVQHTLDEAPPPPPREQLLHEPIGPPLSPTGDVGGMMPNMAAMAMEHLAPPPAAPAPVPKESGQSHPAPSSIPQLDVTATQHKQPHDHNTPLMDGNIRGVGHSTTAHANTTVHAPTQPAAATTVVSSADSHRWRQEQTRLQEQKANWKAEQTARETLLHSISTYLLHTFEDGQRWKTDKEKYERTIAQLKSEIHDKEEKIRWQGEHMRAQETLVTQLQDRVKGLEMTNQKMIKEVESKTRTEAHENRALLHELANHTEAIMKALSPDEEALLAAQQLQGLNGMGVGESRVGPHSGSATPTGASLSSTNAMMSSLNSTLSGGTGTPTAASAAANSTTTTPSSTSAIPTARERDGGRDSQTTTKGRPPEGPMMSRSQRYTKKNSTTANANTDSTRGSGPSTATGDSSTPGHSSTPGRANSINRLTSDTSTSHLKKRGATTAGRPTPNSRESSGNRDGPRNATASPTRYSSQQRDSRQQLLSQNSNHHHDSHHHAGSSPGPTNNASSTPLRTPSPAVSVASSTAPTATTPTSSRKSHSARAATPTAAQPPSSEDSGPPLTPGSTLSGLTYEHQQPPPYDMTQPPGVYTTPPPSNLVPANTASGVGYYRRTSFPANMPGVNPPVSGSSPNPTRDASSAPTTASPYAAGGIPSFGGTTQPAQSSTHLGVNTYGSSQPTSYRSRSPQDLSEQEYLSEANMCF
eukprot:TRINITY_DN64665_c0_g1_i1.p1 TRINITY_DN64665_c0_g1~~TRINITY_DN64665_c0_g1_i1.p1  ORF type:complete len:1177 (-),score=115.09 TRINITY_DN64665_c0_g1_i1:266-3796(-)